jgi:hypothetical protein
MAMISPAAIDQHMQPPDRLNSNRRSIRAHQPNPRPALPARIRLRMKSPVPRIVVLRLARRAHLESRHRSLRPVVRNPPRNREPRPAVGAVQKRIAVPPVRRIQQLPQAIRARRRIRRNPRAHPPQHLAGNNPESRLSQSPPTPAPQSNRSAPAAAPPPQPRQKRLHPLRRPLNLNRHAIRIVPDEPRQPLLLRQPVNKRPEPHSLHHAAHHHPAHPAPQQPHTADKHSVMILQGDRGMQHLLSSKFQIGGDASAAAGPVGRHASADTDWKLNTEILTYSRSKGIFAGLTLNGQVIQRDDDAMRAMYGPDVYHARRTAR